MSNAEKYADTRAQAKKHYKKFKETGSEREKVKAQKLYDQSNYMLKEAGANKTNNTKVTLNHTTKNNSFSLFGSLFGIFKKRNKSRKHKK